MSEAEADKIGMFSKAGIVSSQMYNIINIKERIKYLSKKIRHKDVYYPDKEFLDKLKGKNRLNPNEMINGTNYDINEIKKEIKKNNLYLIEEEKEKKAKKKKEKKNKNKTIEILNKNHLFKSKKYKYYNEHMKRIDKYKTEGIYKTILGQKETSYKPKMDYVYKKILTGPKWETLSSRDVFNLNKLFKKKNNKAINTVNISANNEKRKLNKIKKEKAGSKSRNINRNSFIISNKIILANLSHNKNNKINNTDSINKNFSGINSNDNNNINTNISTNNYLHSSLDNLNFINKILLSFNLNKVTSSKNIPNKLLVIKPGNFTLAPNNIPYNKPTSKKEHLPGPDFKRYLDLEKVERKKKRLQKVPITRITLSPNYSLIQSNPKTFVNYNTKKISLVKKPRKFSGLSSYEFLYDAGKTFDKIYGNKIKAVPKFHKMIARPSDNKYPSYMKGLCSRLGLEYEGEKSLKMNNYENGKMYKSQSFFGEKKNYNKILRNICYEDDIEKGQDKINRDLDIITKRFKNIKYIEYD